MHHLGTEFKLKDAQEEALRNFIGGSDCIGVFQTNYGKYMIYHLAPIVYKYMKENDINYSVIEVSPLTVLIKDQLVSCNLLNIRAIHLTSESTVDELT